jgi:hypothetical protein
MSRTGRVLVGVVAAIAMALTLTGTVYGQSTFASIEGTIVDQAGLVVPGVSVTVTNQDTNVSRDLVTDGRGFYRAPNLPIGTYRVKAQLQGFATAVETGVVLQINQTGVVNFTLKPSGVAETVTVQASPVQVNLVTHELGHTILPKQIMDLPLNGRSFDQLMTLIPGTADMVGIAGIAVAGTRPGSTNFLLNGTDANNNYITESVPGRSGITQSSLGVSSIENIQEFRILTNDYSAEYGRTAGAQINVVTKSGTNTLHGSAFEFWRGNDLASRDYFLAPTAAKPTFYRHQFGGSVGGPIQKNKTFFFASWEDLRSWVPTSSRALVPTDAFRAQTPAVFQAYLPFILKPTDPNYLANGSVDPNLGFVSVTIPVRTREHTFAGNVQRQLSQTDSLTAHLQYDTGNKLTPGTLNALAPTLQVAKNLITNGAWTHIFSSSMVNELRVGYNLGKNTAEFTPQSVPGAPTDNLVRASVTGVGTTIGASTQNNISLPWAWQAIENLSWVRGPHRLKFGFDIRKVDWSEQQAASTTISYTSVAAFFANQVSAATISTGYPERNMHTYAVQGFLQDDIQAAKNLNLNLGVRYEYNTPVQEKNNQQSEYDAATKALVVGQPLYKSDANNFAPRVGFAWNVFGNEKTSLRGGWGIFYDSQFFRLNSMPPFSASYSASSANNPGLTWPLPANYASTMAVPALQAFDPNVKVPYYQQYHINVQRQLGAYMMVDIGYVGNRGYGLLQSIDINRVDPVTKVRPDTRYSNILVRQGTAGSTYNSLQATISRQYHAGWSYQVSYTLSHMRDSMSNSTDSPQDNNNLAGDWGDSQFDRRHVLVGNFIVDVPFGHGRKWGNSWSRPLDILLGGWQLNGIYQYRTGAPFSVVPGTDRRGDGSPATQRVDVVAGVSPYASPQTIMTWLNAAAFAPAALGSYGNSIRDAYRGPSFKDFDMSLFKNIQVGWFGGGKSTLQFRIEAFNVFNQPNFGLPSAFSTSTSFGKITSTVPVSFGGGAMRQVQLAVRFMF